MAKSISKKTVLTNPGSRRETKIDTSIYEPFKAAILKSLKGSKGKTFTDLTDDVVRITSKTFPGFKGSKPWYTCSKILRPGGSLIILLRKERSITALKNDQSGFILIFLKAIPPP
jgi:hypothetical protein